MFKLSKFSKGNVPPSSTPVVRLLRGAAAIIGKRQHGRHFPAHRPSIPSISPKPPRQLAPANSYRIALLSEVPGDDVIVISALATAPFCCHADLLTMSGPQLTAVARVLNESLSPSLRINAEPGCPPAEIRVEIETVVGLRSPPHRPHPVPLVQPLSQSHSEYLVPHHCLVDGYPDTPPLSPKCRLIAPTSAEPTSWASPSPAVRPTRSISDTDVDTPPS
jgi:hypothetical protein